MNYAHSELASLKSSMTSEEAKAQLQALGEEVSSIISTPPTLQLFPCGRLHRGSFRTFSREGRGGGAEVEFGLG